MSRNRVFVLIGLAVALLLAGVVSYYASSAPDGLESTAEDTGFLGSAQDSATSDSPLADYGVSGVGSDRLSVGLAGVIGVLIVLVLVSLLTAVLRRRRTRADAVDDAASGPSTSIDS